MTFLAIRQALLAKPKTMRKWIFFAGICSTVLFAVMTVYEPIFFRFLDNKAYDSLIRSEQRPANKQAPANPVIVDIDEKSLARFGQWPWPRYRIALLLQKIQLLGATGIGLDMVFPEPDRTSLAVVQQDIRNQFGLRLDFTDIPANFKDNDVVLAKVLSRGPYILGYSFLFSGQDSRPGTCIIHPVSTIVASHSGTSGLPAGLFKAGDATCSLDILASSVPFSGFFNVIPDEDGVLRRSPLLIEYNGKAYPSLPLATVMQARGTRQVTLKTGKNGLESIRLENRDIPVDSRANLLIKFNDSKKHFMHISASDVLLDKISPSLLQGKLVFVGTSAVGLEEHRTTPLMAAVPGVDIHATIVDNILTGDFYSRPGWAPGMELLLVIACGILSALLLSWTRSVLSFCIITAGCATLWLASGWALHNEGIFVSPLVPMLTLGGNFTLLTFLKYLREEKTVKSRDRELVAMQNFTIQCLAALTETRDSETGRHIERCQHYVKLLSDHLARQTRFAETLNDETIDLLYRSASLHDIGKVGVPDSILLKPSTLTEDEYQEMKKHTLYGREAIQRAELLYGKDVKDSFLQFGKVVAYSHHERWDGTGYPDGLAGEEIPLFGRIMAIADVYDALICKRRYKPSFTHDEAVAIITHNRGSQFDPIVVDAFLEVQEEFHKVAQQLPDE